MNSFDLSDLALASPAGEGMLSHLENPFADPLCFLRELVQNAIDAGSAQVDVTCAFEADREGTLRRPAHALAEDLGTATIRVADFGEGMDRHVIDTHLTRLFSSEKEGDRTKIGKFGVGFSSVFLLKPDAVCVDTGRYGESWRLVFRPDRTFTRVRLSEPIEGTTIRLFKAMARSEFEGLERSVLRALHHYCPHVDVALRYQGERLGSPLNLSALDASIKGEAFEQQAEIVVGFTREGSPDTASFYNRGLTLLVRPSELPGVSYKINSPGIEPTLGRDFVVPNEHYHQVLRVVRQLACGALVEQLSQRLDEGLHHGDEEAAIANLQRPLATLLRLGVSLPAGCAHHVVACSPHGHLYTLFTCEEAAREGRLFGASHPSPLSAAACAEGQLVLEDWQGELLAALCRGQPPRLERVLVLPLTMKETDRARWTAGEALRAATLALLKSVAAPVSIIELGYLDYPGSGAGSLPAVVQARPFTVSRLAEALPREQKWLQRSGQSPARAQSAWVLNADHPTLRALLPLALREPELAAYLLINLCLLGGPLTPALESGLLTQALARRYQRQEAPLTERLMASLTAEGAIDSPGFFTINPDLARERIRRSYLPNPLRYVLHLVQAASLKGATHISFQFGAGDLQMYFDGAPFSQSDLEQLSVVRLSKEGSGAAEARRLLAMGIYTALQIDPALVQVESGSAFVELRPGRSDRHGVVAEPKAWTHIRLQQRLGLGLIKRYLEHLGGHLTEEVLLQERCVHAQICIELDGRQISQGHTLSSAMPWQAFAAGEISGAVDIAPLPPIKRSQGEVQMSPELPLSLPLLRLVQNGVWVDTQLPIELLPGFRAVAESSSLRLDVVGEHVIQGEIYAATLKAVAAAQLALLTTLCRQHLGDAAAQEDEKKHPALGVQHLGALLRGLLRLGGLRPLLRWTGLPLDQLPPEPTESAPGWPATLEDAEALLDVPIFASTSGIPVPLRLLLAEFGEHKTVAYSAHRTQEPARARQLVLHIAEPASESLLRGLFGSALECRDVLPKLAWEREPSMTAWRGRPHRRSLSSQVFIARVPLSGPDIAGEIGIEPHQLGRLPWQRRLNQPCILDILLVQDGNIMLEKTVPFPVPDITVVMTGRFTAGAPVEELLSEEQLAAILEAVFSALPLLLEQLVNLGDAALATESGVALLARDDETMTWWACVLRRLLTLTLSAEARHAVRGAMGIHHSPAAETGAGEFHPNPLWIQLRELPIFEALDGTPLRPSELEAAAAHHGYLAVLCPSSTLHPQQLERWADICLADVPPPVTAGSELTPAGPREPLPFVLWLAPQERALRDQLWQQLAPTQIVDAEPWLRVASATAAANSPPCEGLPLAAECELSVPLGSVDGLLGVLSESALSPTRQPDPRVAVALFQERQSVGSEEVWLPGGQFLCAVAEHAQLRLSADLLGIAEGAGMTAVRTALAAALPALLTLLTQRTVPVPLYARRVVLDAVAALFPSLTLRLAYQRLLLCTRSPHRDAADAERDYAALLQLAVATSLERVDSVLELHLAHAGPLFVGRVTWDVLHSDADSYMSISTLSISAEQETQSRSQPAAPPPGAMAWIDALYPGTQGLAMGERALHILPALARAPLLVAADGAPLTLAEVILDFEQHGHVLCAPAPSADSTAQAAAAGRRPVILDHGEELRPVLGRLFGPDNVWECSAAHRSAPPLSPPPVAGQLDQAQDPAAHASSGRLLAAVMEELRALPRIDQRLFDAASSDWLKLGEGQDAAAVSFERESQQCTVSGEHPAVRLMQQRFDRDPQCARFLASTVYTAVCIGSGAFGEEESRQFHRQLAVRALAASRNP